MNNTTQMNAATAYVTLLGDHPTVLMPRPLGSSALMAR